MLLRPPVPLRSRLSSLPQITRQVPSRIHHLPHPPLHLNRLLVLPLTAAWAMALRASPVINLKPPLQAHNLNQSPHQQPNPLCQLLCKLTSLLPLLRHPAEHSALSQVFSWEPAFRRRRLHLCPVSKQSLHRSPHQPRDQPNPSVLVSPAAILLLQAPQASKFLVQAGVTLAVSPSSSTIVTKRRERTPQCRRSLVSQPLPRTNLGPFPASRPMPRPRRVRIHQVHL